MSCGIDCANPPSTQPIVKITIAVWYSTFLLNRSESLPQMGVVAVEVSSIAVTTHVYWPWVPWRSARMVGRALETMVEDSIATSRAESRPVKALRICRCGMDVVTGLGGVGLDGADVVAPSGWWARRSTGTGN